MRVSYNGNTSDFQSDDDGAIPSTRSKLIFDIKHLDGPRSPANPLIYKNNYFRRKFIFYLTNQI